MNICLSAPVKTGGTKISDPSIKNRLISAATDLFAEQGFAGTSVREICTKADASVPMISHYFGSKQGLLDEIVRRLSRESFEVPLRLIEGELRSKEEFRTKLELFISETFAILIDLAPVFRIVGREGGDLANVGIAHEALSKFLAHAQEKGFLRADLRTDLTTGLILDRLGNQIIYAVSPSYTGPNVISDERYRKDWLTANTDALLFGLASQ